MQKSYDFNIWAELLDSFFSAPVLISLNLIIIILVENIGQGLFFYKTGLIHAIAIFFVILAVLRAFLHYYSYDAFLEKFIDASTIALLLLAASHLVEFFSYTFFKLPDNVSLANVVNFYIISLLIISLGVELFLDARKKNPNSWYKLIYFALISFFTVLIFLFMLKPGAISLETSSKIPIFYFLASLIIVIYALRKIFQIYTIVSISRKFSLYLMTSAGVIFLSTLPNIFYDYLTQRNVAISQVIYISHFFFYFALTMIFLSFRTLAHLGGIYESLDNDHA